MRIFRSLLNATVARLVGDHCRSRLAAGEVGSFLSCYLVADVSVTRSPVALFVTMMEPTKVLFLAALCVWSCGSAVALACARLRVAEHTILRYSNWNPKPDLPYVKYWAPW